MQRLEERRWKALGKENAASDLNGHLSLNPMAAPFVPGLGAGTQAVGKPQVPPLHPYYTKYLADFKRKWEVRTGRVSSGAAEELAKQPPALVT